LVSEVPRWSPKSPVGAGVPELIDAHPEAGPLHLIKSPYGHDGFLIELDQVGPLIADTLGA
jgi:homoserine acetyltransferase